MEYPNSKFTRPFRVALLLFFLALFFIISPILILYTTGYRYDWKHGLLKETGAISIDVKPTNAIVYLNGTKLKNKMPIRLKNLTPNKYKLKITASGYYDWIKDIEVKNKQTVYIKDIVMLKKSMPQILVEKKVRNFGLSQNGEFLIYSIQKNNNTEIWIKNLKEGSELLSLVYPNKKQIKITWAKNSSLAIISEEIPPYKNIFIINPNNPSKELNIAKKIKEDITKFQWNNNTSKPYIFFSTKQKIMSFFPDSEQILTIGNNNYSDWYMENEKLWTLQYNKEIRATKITRDALGFSSEFTILENNGDTGTTPKQWDLIVAKENTILLKKNNKPEMILVTKNKKFNISGEKFLISEDNDWWLIWSPWELWTYVNNEEPYLLNRSGEQLKEVISVDKNNTLALVWAKKLTIIFPYYLVSHDLLNVEATDVYINKKTRTMYLNAKINNKNAIWSLKY